MGLRTVRGDEQRVTIGHSTRPRGASAGLRGNATEGERRNSGSGNKESGHPPVFYFNEATRGAQAGRLARMGDWLTPKDFMPKEPIAIALPHFWSEI